VGGTIGAVGFLVGVMLLGDLTGRLLGAAAVGFCIGAMIALIEAAFREAWLEIHYGPKETRTVTLGRKPVTIGSNPEACTVFASSAPDVALRYTLGDGRIACEDVPASRTFDVVPGDRRKAGNLSVVVCAARSSVPVSPPKLSRPGPTGTKEQSSSASPQQESDDADYYLCIRGRRIPLSLGTKLSTSDIAGLETTSADGTVAEVVPHPKNPEILGLKNLSTRTWSGTVAGEKRKDVEPGKSIRVAVGTQINFGVLKAVVE